MKNKSILKKFLVCAILASTILSAAACSKQNDESPSPSPTPEASIQNDVYEEKIAYCLGQIADLEAQLAEKKQEIYVSESKYQLEIAALEVTISSLKAQLDALQSANNQNSSNQNGSNQNGSNQNNANQNNSNQNNSNQNNSNQNNSNQNNSNQNGSNQNNSNQNNPGTTALPFTYIKENNGITITKYTGSDAEVTIPDTIDGLPVLCIGESAFASSRVKSVIIPEGVKKIDWFAFQACTQLIEISIPASVTKIEYGAFEYAKSSFIIKCPKGSFVEAYAKSWGYLCVAK